MVFSCFKIRTNNTWEGRGKPGKCFFAGIVSFNPLDSLSLLTKVAKNFILQNIFRNKYQTRKFY